MNDHSERAHAIYAPSAAYRNLNCLGAIAMCDKAEKKRIKEGTKKKESEFAAEGTKAHEWIGYALEQGEGILSNLDDRDMADHIRNYLAFVKGIDSNFKKVFPKMEVFNEYRVRFDDDLWGTADKINKGVKTARKELIICDFKYGRGVEVEAEDNEQLTCYAMCAEKEFKTKFDRVHFFIYQPRTPGKEFSRWTIERKDLDESTAKISENKKKCLQILADDTGQQNTCAGEWCRFCDAKLICKSHLGYINDSALAVLDTAPPLIEVEALSLKQKIAIFNRRKVIKQLIEAVASDLHDMALRGEEIPGMKMVHGQQRRQWNDEPGNIGPQLNKLGVKDPYKLGLIGIGDVEKEIGKGKLANLTCLTKANVQLVPLDDKREAIDSGFNGLEEIEFKHD